MKRVLFLLMGISGCVGTDYVDDPVVGEKIIVSDEIIALMPTEQAQVDASYFDRYVSDCGIG